jgi:methionine-rich copper-binding protein CopC
VVSKVACENTQPGTSPTVWDVGDGASENIEGFTTDISTNVGGTVRFKIRTVGSYTLDIYRLGYYGGNGARKITTLTPTPLTQPSCLTQPATGLIDCGNWGVSASWTVPATAVSGVYVAHVKRTNGEENHVVFVVRDDASTSKMVFQTSDTTWQAYNNWGGNSLYTGEPVGRAYKVSYNRPFRTRMGTPSGRDFVFANEYPMIRFLERNGYDVSYITGIDADRAGALIRNHKMFLSVGHDEYWSGQQRANVEAARDAGVHLAFFSGNEVYWRTRYETSIDGSGIAYRTLVAYKETFAGTKIDPAPESTGTWRDPRFGPTGGRPENSLTGTFFTVNCCSYAMKVPAADGKMRFWRNTSIATQAAGGVATLPDQTLGYEWDEDLDNGSRPRGLIRMSSTTETVAEYIQGFGDPTTKPGLATHSLTLYRAPSGALVFGAGTVQWSWGLDGEHDGSPVPVDIRMQQATVNLFADMGVQPNTLMAGVTAATASTDTTPPQSNITSPAPNASIANGSSVTVSGTAADLGGGRIGGVEVSTDGGTTWHPATGRETWTYSWRVTGRGQVTLKTRATDDSANVENTGVGTTVNVTCPCSIFGSTVPPGSPAADSTPLELGVRFRPTANGFITGVRFYKGAGNTGTHTGSLWSATGTRLATATFAGESATGWQSVQFQTPVAVTAGTTYVASYFAPAGNYHGTSNAFLTAGVNSPPLTALRDGADGPNGVYREGGSGFPSSTFSSTNYWVDVLFDTVGPADTTKPTVTETVPPANASSVNPATKPRVTFSEPIQASTLSMVVRNPAGTAVAGTVAYDETTRAATFTPGAALALNTRYTVTVSGARDLATTPNTMDTFAYSFTTWASEPPPGSCPCSIWTDATVPATVSVDDRSELELGVKFRADSDGFVEGVRFYKGPNNTGTHVGTLWRLDGTELASATFTTESSSGWQEVRFSNPVAVTAGTVYVASYHTTTGWYSATVNGLTAPVVNAPLTALGHNQSGPNGVFRYGARGFPTEGIGTNYFVDVVFNRPADTAPPQVTATNPAGNASSVPVGAKVAATFNENLSANGTFTVTGPAGAVAGSTGYDGARRTLVFTPAAPLAAATTYTAAVNGARDTSGNTATAFTWSFKTAGACPCSIFPSDATPGTASSGDRDPVELGVKFTADTAGSVTGLRFYKGPNNTGTHVGRLWRADGTLLKTATFTNETATGWQTVTFPSPLEVTAGTTYVASYHAPAGGYAVDGGFFTAGAHDNAPLHALSDAAATGNGVYRYGPSGSFPNETFGGSNYWVDVLFTTGPATDTQAPAVESTDPVDGQTSVPPSAGIRATFDEPVQAATVQFTLTGPGSTAVAGTASYDAASTTSRFTPASPLAYNTVYTASVTGARDLAGNTMAGIRTWSFRTAPAPGGGGCPCTIWPDTAVPPVTSHTDPGAVEVGTKFRADSAGYVTGVRFFKGAGNTGSHVGNLWTADGTLLAKVVFSGESTAGWQQANFTTPVAITANTTYVVSYHAPNGRYAVTLGGFASAGVDSPPLHALANGVDGPNGVYRYGADAFPINGSDHNYWVDVVFTTTLPTDTTAPAVTSSAPAAGATGAAATTTPTATFSEPVEAASVRMTVTGPGTTAVTGTTTYDSATRAARFAPAAALAYSTVYTVSVSGARDAAGNPMAAPHSWSFTTGPAPDSTPPTVTASTPAANATAVATTTAPTATFSEGVQPATVQFTLTNPAGAAVAGAMTYDATTRVATFTPTAVLAGSTQYTARVSGAKDTAGNTQAAAMAWTFTTGAADTTAPTVTTLSPASAASEVSMTTAPAATFSEPIQAATAQFTLTGPSGAVTGTTAYDAATRVLRFAPAATLASGTRYTASVSGARDLSGNTMAVRTWAFSTACPCSLWPGTATPVTLAAAGTRPIEVGVKFRSDKAGFITAIRFYKGPGNTGTHLGRIWSSTGTLMRSVIFTGETASGWQQVDLSPAVAINANTVYVASTWMPTGKFPFTSGGYASGRVALPLRAPTATTTSPNGVYRYDTAGFPTAGLTHNYWVDVVYSTSSTATTTTTTTTTRSATSPTEGATTLVAPPVTAVEPPATGEAEAPTATATPTGTATATGAETPAAGVIGSPEPGLPAPSGTNVANRRTRRRPRLDN